MPLEASVHDTDLQQLCLSKDLAQLQAVQQGEAVASVGTETLCLHLKACNYPMSGSHDPLLMTGRQNARFAGLSRFFVKP